MWFYKIEKEGKDIHVTWNTTMTYLKNTFGIENPRIKRYMISHKMAIFNSHFNFVFLSSTYTKHIHTDGVSPNPR